MKLKNLAALIFRIIGASFITTGLDDLIEDIVDGYDFVTGMTKDVGVYILGFCLILFSKKVAALFCKGLDDDTAA